jgi:hypothetical protein
MILREKAERSGSFQGLGSHHNRIKQTKAATRAAAAFVLEKLV